MYCCRIYEMAEENPDWDKDWQAGVASAVSGVGDYQDKLPQGLRSSKQR